MGNTHKLLLFGAFEVDLTTEELRNGGTLVKLQPQPFKLLALLASRPDEIIARDEIQKLLWDKETFVDFEKGVNKCVLLIRNALNDNPDRPRYVETIPRRGYRFLAPVKSKTIAIAAGVVESSPGTAPAGLASDRLAVAPSPAIPSAAVQEPMNTEGAGTKLEFGYVPAREETFEKNTRPACDVSFAREAISGTSTASTVKEQLGALFDASPGEAGRRWRKRSLVGSLTIAAFLGAWLWHWHSHSQAADALMEKDTFVLADFMNSTGEQVFDGTLKTALSLSLAQSPFLNELPDDKVRATLQLMARPADTVLTAELARELCLRAGSKAYVAGAISRLGNEYVLALNAVNCRNGTRLAQQQVTAATKEKVLEALGHAAAKLRTKLGESMESVKRLDVPLELATTPSLEALKAYSLGEKTNRDKGHGPDLPYFQRAIELDPNFAMAYRSIGQVYETLGQEERAYEYYAKAFQLRDHTSERERLILTSNYTSYIGDLDAAAQASQAQVDLYPNSHRGYVGWTIVFLHQGRWEEAVGASRKAASLAPDDAGAIENVAVSLLGAQRFDEAKRVIHDAQSHGMDHEGFRAFLYLIAFFSQDSLSMAEQKGWFDFHDRYRGQQLECYTKAYHGQLAATRALWKQTVDSSVLKNQDQLAAGDLEDAALFEAAIGYDAEAKRDAAAGLMLDRMGRDTETVGALALAMADDSARSASIAADLDQRYPQNMQMRSLWLPAIRAQIALNRKNPAEALSALQVAVFPLEVGQVDISGAYNSSCMFHTYIRGQAYLASGQGGAAADEFQKIIQHSGVVGNCWTGAVARLQLARAYLMIGDTNAARESYQEFLTLWKDADPDIPIYRQAKAEYGKLK